MFYYGLFFHIFGLKQYFYTDYYKLLKITAALKDVFLCSAAPKKFFCKIIGLRVTKGYQPSFL